ncbi:unnamed protein product [Microthlaspi erraticum]|uniref:Uncharacterized protein n=1 Tax=Microthlaspi erraticum TaxID=1685480 RepID=A0A6D2KKP9_9BRAS|nr:unnamed protein product [Microthlaspi erraticum]
MEAEYRAFTAAAQEITWLSFLLCDLGIEQRQTTRTSGTGLIETQHVPAAQQLADVFTKSLPKKSFIDLRRKLGVAEPPTLSLRGDVSESSNSTHLVEAQSLKSPTPKPNHVQRKKTKPVKYVAPEEEEMLCFNRFEFLSSMANG